MIELRCLLQALWLGAVAFAFLFAGKQVIRKSYPVAAIPPVRIRLAVLTIGAMLWLAACQTILRVEKGVVVGYGTRSPEASYFSIRIDLAADPGRAMPDFCVRLGDQAEPMRSNQLTEAIVSRNLSQFESPAYLPPSRRRQADDYTSYQGNGYFISFLAERPIFISLSTREQDRLLPETPATTPAVIGPPDCSALHPLPISRHLFIEIFGLPDREFTVREVYY